MEQKGNTGVRETSLWRADKVQGRDNEPLISGKALIADVSRTLRMGEAFPPKCVLPTTLSFGLHNAIFAEKDAKAQKEHATSCGYTDEGPWLEVTLTPQPGC